jgi:hypothetical protein
MKEYKPIADLKEKDFVEYPVWAWVEDLDREDLVRPVFSIHPLPEGERNLFISSRFTLASGLFTNGFISVRCSDKVVYAISLFIRGHEFQFALSISDLFDEEIQRMMEALKLTRQDILPIEFETDYHFNDMEPLDGIIE